MGSSTNGTDFTAGGPDATLTGNGSKTAFTYETNVSAFTVSAGQYLAIKITNNSASNYAVQTGGAWSYCSSPPISILYTITASVNNFHWGSINPTGSVVVTYGSSKTFTIRANTGYKIKRYLLMELLSQSQTSSQ